MPLMDEHLNISNSKQIAPPLDHKGPPNFQMSRDAESAHRVSEPMSDSEFKIALERLSNSLASEKPFRRDVPRGFYLNIRI